MQNFNFKQAIEKPFTFISYSHSIPLTKERVEKLAKYLWDNNVNVVYDTGGLTIGTDKSTVMNYILHKNCKAVLVVTDSSYVLKTTEKQSGVYAEYMNILKRLDEIKVVPLIAKEDPNALVVPPALTELIYKKVLDNDVNTFKEVLLCVPPECKKKKDKTDRAHREEAELYYNAANTYFDRKMYDDAEESITKAIKLLSKVRHGKWRRLTEFNIFLTALYIKMDEKVENAKKSMEDAYACYAKLGYKDDALKLTLDFNQARLLFETDKVKCLQFTEKLMESMKSVLDINCNAKEVYSFHVLHANALYNAGFIKEARIVESKALDIVRKYNLEDIERFYRLSNIIEHTVNLIKGKKYTMYETKDKLDEAWEFMLEAEEIVRSKQILPEEIEAFYNVAINLVSCKKEIYAG